MAPRRGVDQLPGLQILQVVVGDHGHGQQDRGDEQREGHQRLGAAVPALKLGDGGQDHGGAQHRQDGQARDRAVGRAHQSGHVAANGRDHEPRDHDVGQRGGDQGDGGALERATGEEHPGLPAHGQQQAETDRGDDADGDILFGARQRRALAGGSQPRGRHGGGQASPDRQAEAAQRPDRGRADGAGADEAHLCLPDAGGQVDHQAHQQGDAHGDTHQVPGAHHGQGEARAHAGRRAPEPRIAGDLGGEHFHADQGREQRRSDRTDDDGDQSRAALGDRGGRVDGPAGAHLEHLRGGHAFRVGQGRLGHQRPAQRNGIHHPQRAADGADPKAHPERKARPPADHHQAWQDEDDRRQGAGRRGDRLDDVVLLDGDAAEQAQGGHGDHRRRDRRGECQPHLEAQVDVGGGEDDAQHRSQDQAADGQFVALGGVGHGRRLMGFRRLSRALRELLAPLAAPSPPTRWCAPGPLPVLRP